MTQLQMKFLTGLAVSDFSDWDLRKSRKSGIMNYEKNYVKNGDGGRKVEFSFNKFF